MKRTTRQDQREGRRPRFNGADGFSVIEMLIAMVVIAVGLVSIVAISSYVSRANTISNNLNVLAAAAQDQADRLRTAVWTSSSEDPAISVGGSVSSEYTATPTQSYSTSAAATPTGGTTTSVKAYTYTKDPNNPHHATVSSTPSGDLNVSWQVRQGGTPDLRYVTIRAVQVGAPANMREGFTVTTIIVRN